MTTTTRTAPRKINLSLARPGQRVAFGGEHLTITRVRANGTARIWVNATREIEGTTVSKAFGASVHALCYDLSV